jgi:hypothetical protein
MRLLSFSIPVFVMLAVGGQAVLAHANADEAKQVSVKSAALDTMFAELRRAKI